MPVEQNCNYPESCVSKGTMFNMFEKIVRDKSWLSYNINIT